MENKGNNGKSFFANLFRKNVEEPKQTQTDESGKHENVKLDENIEEQKNQAEEQKHSDGFSFVDQGCDTNQKMDDQNKNKKETTDQQDSDDFEVIDSADTDFVKNSDAFKHGCLV